MELFRRNRKSEQQKERLEAKTIIKLSNQETDHDFKDMNDKFYKLLDLPEVQSNTSSIHRCSIYQAHIAQICKEKQTNHQK